MSRYRFRTALGTAVIVLGIIVVATEPLPSPTPAVAFSGRVTTTSCSNLSLRPGPEVSPSTGEHAITLKLRNDGAHSCILDGYPKLTLLSAKGDVLPFTYHHEHPAGAFLMTKAPPRRVVLKTHVAAFVLVAQFRCDLGDQARAAVLDLVAPGSVRVLRLRIATRVGNSAFFYCKGGRGFYGNVIAFSPVEATLAQVYGPTP